MIVMDSTDRERLFIVKSELQRILASEDLANASILVFANKQDLKGAMSPAEITSVLGLDQIRDHSWHIQGCCALTGEGLFAGLDWMLTMCANDVTCVDDIEPRGHHVTSSDSLKLAVNPNRRQTFPFAPPLPPPFPALSPATTTTTTTTTKATRPTNGVLPKSFSLTVTPVAAKGPPSPPGPGLAIRHPQPRSGSLPSTASS
eukprot:CAMPEP_0196654538 /NCGR_PEP_ID=MMETSP1086-20130531/4257_1 /TAXON_ID=77921 /ORGANISM="Cyanoptyche  gloeocystis , Strain SAG4.97" /LENGTH=201 /DNA_ID=CAMNT_0041986365 /DNA_START=396 /DNA_END=999 /DNA_ORIENTATION=-